jgi:hypothetical protein
LSAKPRWPDEVLHVVSHAKGKMNANVDAVDGKILAHFKNHRIRIIESATNGDRHTQKSHDAKFPTYKADFPNMKVNNISRGLVGIIDDRAIIDFLMYRSCAYGKCKR